MNSKWGAHDGVVADAMLMHLRRQTSPFFCTWLTLSSHEPFETPVKPVFQDKSETGLFVNSLHYTDSILFHFISKCQKEAFWKNTLFIIIADHGHRLPTTNKEIDRFRIPMLWLGGAIKNKPEEITTTGAQTDLAATLLAQLKLPSSAFPWSRNMMSKGYRPSAYFSFNNGFGYTKPNGYFIFDNTGKQMTEQSGIITPYLQDTGKAIQQMSFADYLGK
jgi:phosphoglycerol transferase MdoB-like AlkP superfamily enzyme